MWMLAVTVWSMSSGGLLTDRIPAGVHLVQNLAPSPAAPLDTAASLREQLEELQDSMPSLAAPIGLVITGGVGTLGGAIFIYAGVFVAALNGGLGVLIGGGIAMAIGIPLLIVGAILLSKTLKERRAVSHDLNAVQRQLRLLEAGQPRPVQPPPAALPPQVQAPTPTLLLAEF